MEVGGSYAEGKSVERKMKEFGGSFDRIKLHCVKLSMNKTYY